MNSGRGYRLAAATGTVAAVVAAVALANAPAVQGAVTTTVPLLDRLQPTTLDGRSLSVAVGTALVAVTGAMLPLFRPRPRRTLDTVLRVQRRVLLAGLALATVGYFDYTYRLPRTTLVLTVATLAVVLPAWFVAVGRRPEGDRRAVVVGDDPDVMAAVRDAADVPVVGYVSPPSGVPAGAAAGDRARPEVVADGGLAGGVGEDLPLLGGLSRLDDVLVDRDVTTVLTAFARRDRGEFFGMLDTCHEHGVRVKTHRDRVNGVLTDPGAATDELVTVDLQPWDPQDRVLKRAFDVAFAALGLLALAPVVAAVAVAIKLDSPGPVLYRQERTAQFGETFVVHKFRSMTVDAEAGTGPRLSEADRGGRDPRVTRVGRVLRRTHLDEIPQLWAVLRGDMSVVGPRPERPELDSTIELDVAEWRARWFVKPGLTGLAQVNDVTGHQPRRKLRHDVEYIRRQSLAFDARLVARQLRKVGVEAAAFVRDGLGN